MAVWSLDGVSAGAGRLAGATSAPRGTAGQSASPSTVAQPPQAGASEATKQQALMKRYCMGCHNARLKTAGLSLDALDFNNVGAGAETWEKVFRKLRAHAMPPASSPRPDHDSYAALTTWVQSELDRAAALSPNAGRTAVYHRLTRLEYQNAVRDILGLEFPMSSLLPGDDAAFGFDNIGDMLSVSPDLLDGYMSAANKISRLAVGEASVGLGSRTYTVARTLLQSDRMSEDLPFGSRGGTAFRHYFPADGEYIVQPVFNGSSRPAQPVEVRIDDVRVARFETTGSGLAKADNSIRVPVKAGAHVVGVSFIKPILPNETRFVQYFPWGNSGIGGAMTGATTYLTLERVAIDGPYDASGLGDTPSRRRIFVCQPATAREEHACATKILNALARRAFRRPLTPADTDSLVGFYALGRKEMGFEQAVQFAIERLLVDPDFLFRVERDPAAAAPGKPYRVSDLELASRLSFFLWSSVPDEELLRAAELGKLKDPAELERQTRRMLADPRSSMLVENFAAQWFYLRNVLLAKPDAFQFPDFDDNLRDALAQETELFLEDQIRQDRGVPELLTANYTFLNERLAKHYGIPGVYGSHFRRVTLPEGKRGGLLGHGSILMVTSFANRTSAVVRGKWLLENFLNYQPPPPPPNVPDFPENKAGDRPRSARERMETHRANPVCAGCHSVMDPLGFSLENYDAIGKYRQVADGGPVEAGGVMPDGTKFEGMEGLRDVMHARREEFVGTAAEKMLTFALGRGIEYYDQPTIRKIVRDAARNDYKWSSVVLGITNSLPFQMRMRKG
jgi:mono/diheme cytochrome c family protein